MRRTLALVLPFASLALLPALVRGEDIKDKAALDAQWKALATRIAARHVELAKALEKSAAHEAVLELALAIEVSPDDKTAREKLGFKRDGAVWRGYPQLPPPTAEPLEEKLRQRQKKEH